MQAKNSVGVATYSGAAPGLQAALHSPQIQKPDPYFGGQNPWKEWLPTLAIATHYPYVQKWNAIDRAVADGVSAALLGKKTPQQALDDAAAQVNSWLAG